MEKNNEEQLREKYLEIQILSQNLNNIQEYSGTLGNEISALTQLEDSLTQFKDLKEESEILVQLGAGIFAKAKIKETEKVFTDVGAKVIVKKTIPETIESITKQKEELQTLSNQIKSQIEEITEKQKELMDELKDVDK